MAQRRSIARVASRARSADSKARRAAGRTPDSAAPPAIDGGSFPTSDSFVNFAQKLGIGADNPLSTAGYGFNPISRIRTILEWIHRGSWLGGVAVDLVADDMTRAGIEQSGIVDPEEIERIEEYGVELGVWNSINELIKWGRLYGGAIAVMMIDGQDPSTPMRIETVARNQFQGLLVLDRWMVDPSLNDLVTRPGRSLGMPKFYNVVADAPALPRMRIHYSRCFRFDGIQLPYWQRVQENLWGISVLERLYDRMIAFDSATTGAAQLVYKAYIRTYAVEGMRDAIGMGGKALDGIVKYVDMIRRFQGMEGITLLDAKDKMETMQHSAFSGLSDVLLQFGQQLSGALQIPLVRLFGQSPSGLNSSGESDIRTYYDGIQQQQQRHLKVPVTSIYRMMAQSLGIQLPEGYAIKFKNLWQLTDKEKSDIAEADTRSITSAEEAGLISQQTAMRELRQSSQITGRFTNISDKDIEAAEESLPPAGEEAIRQQQEMQEQAGGPGGDDGGDDGNDDGGGAPPTTPAEPKPTGDKAPPPFQESKIKRAPAGTGKGGQFTGKTGGAKAASSSSGSTGPSISIKPAKQRAFQGAPIDTKTKLSKLETGAIGEAIVLQHLKMAGVKDAKALNMQTNNFPVDLIADHQLIEVKSGLVSNGPSAQKWRATIGQPGKEERAWLAKASAEKKAKWNAAKMKAILDRKHRVLKDMSKLAGQPLKARTVTTIINPDTKTVDVFVFEGFHLHLRWNNEATKKAYVGSYRYG